MGSLRTQNICLHVLWKIEIYLSKIKYASLKPLWFESWILDHLSVQDAGNGELWLWARNHHLKRSSTRSPSQKVVPYQRQSFPEDVQIVWELGKVSEKKHKKSGLLPNRGNFLCLTITCPILWPTSSQSSPQWCPDACRLGYSKLHQSVAAQKLLGIVGDREGGLWTLEMDGGHQAAAGER